ncbi:MAG: AsmA family protein [Lentisphaeria bacterium]|nr:AsmA family protein [Lentisphaeria bacterium]
MSTETTQDAAASAVDAETAPAPASESPEQPEKKRNGKWLRVTLRILTWTVAVLAALLILALIFRDMLIKGAVTGIGSWLTGTDITLEKFETSLVEGDVRIVNLKIANPNGYEKPYLLELDSFYLNLDVPTLLGNPLVIEEIEVSGLRVVGEFRSGGKFNAVELMENLQKKVPASEVRETAPETIDPEAVREAPESRSDDAADEPPPRTISIKMISIGNSSATVYDDRVGIPVVVPLAYSSSALQFEESRESIIVLLNNLALQMQKTCSGVANAGELVTDAGKQLLDSTGKAGKQLLDSTGKAGKQLTESGKKLIEVFKF